MTAKSLRKKVHSYIDDIDENVLEAVYNMLRIYVDEDGNSLMSAKQKAEVEKRSIEFRNGKTKSYSWEQVKRKTRSRK
jgi:putative addiction module component